MSALAVMYVNGDGTVDIASAKPLGATEVATGDRGELQRILTARCPDGSIPKWNDLSGVQRWSAREKFKVAVRRELRT